MKATLSGSAPGCVLHGHCVLPYNRRTMTNGRNKNMKTHMIAAALSVLAIGSAHAATSWIDWQNTTTGTLQLGTTSVGVHLSGPAWDLVNGDTYFNNTATGGTSATGTYAGLAPSDLIRVYNTGTFTLTFDTPVLDPVLALVSVGQPGYGVNYSFDHAFSVVSHGSNYWGYTGYSTSGTTFTGLEFNGVLQFSGQVSSLTFTVQNPEYWHGFNAGAVAAVPEPETWGMLLAGAGAVALVRRRRRA